MDIPTGVDVKYFRPSAEVSDSNTIAFCGSMDWLPNEDAVRYFLDDIFPLIKTKAPNARLVVVGRNPSPQLQKSAEQREDVCLTGWVDDTRPYLANAGVIIVPLRIGGGTRMKIFEAMAMGKVVVSTSIGAEGLPVSDGVNTAIEDQAAAFAERVCALMGDKNLRDSLGRTARVYVEEHFSWGRVAKDFEAICQAATE